ncbi:hypothetical protein RhiirC2_197302 [Rhizophagus irregularis]|uniref:Uncharacterized protein n=1 Tax=Rhizophagus irregularis TaxID=588596 RepID=A0A2N1NQ77_9GLOM|nr:hypothetical protein RhiirC2_197302 [Rhizophagus irregularis]
MRLRSDFEIGENTEEDGGLAKVYTTENHQFYYVLLSKIYKIRILFEGINLYGHSTKTLLTFLMVMTFPKMMTFSMATTFPMMATFLIITIMAFLMGLNQRKLLINEKMKPKETYLHAKRQKKA